MISTLEILVALKIYNEYSGNYWVWWKSNTVSLKKKTSLTVWESEK